MEHVASQVGTALGNALLMAWEVWWALVLGFAVSGVVQAWVPREQIQARLAGGGGGPLVWATGLGAASSSCSYAATAIAKSLFQKGASAMSAIAFQFASTNLVWELGLVIWVLIGWQFTLAQFLGGFVMILLMAAMLRVFIPAKVEAQARDHAISAESGHQHHMSSADGGWRERLTSVRAWSDVAHNFRGDWQMLWKEITAGFLLAGVVSLVPERIFRDIFDTGLPGPLNALENAVLGVLIAVATFVCSVGNVPLAAVLWSGGISFGGVIAFIFADLLVLPIIAIYRKYYGWNFTLRLVGLMFVTMVIAALAINALFSTAGLIPATRPSPTDVFGSVALNYTFVLNVIATVVFVTLIGLTIRRGVTDPVCGMSVDRTKARHVEYRGKSFSFCSEHCQHSFQSDPDRYVDTNHEPGSSATVRVH
jgi:uncharacterized membrane protein YraQ (UPF0718 family)/YHS domain-containing protein